MKTWTKHDKHDGNRLCKIFFLTEASFLENQHPYQRYYLRIKPALKSKREEFILLGLQEVTEKDIWESLIKKKWKKPQEDIHLYEIIQNILSLTTSDYMTYKTVEAYRAPNVFTGLTNVELKELLKD
jgi:hypothetical protein